MPRRFYKTTFEVVVLSADEPPGDDVSLESVLSEMEGGDYLGTWVRLSTQRVDEPDIGTECSRMGNDGTFFDPE